MASEANSRHWWAHLGSNQGPSDYESAALTAELWARRARLYRRRRGGSRSAGGRLRLTAQGAGAGAAPTELVAMLLDAYASPATPEALPGLRAAIASTEGYDPSMRVAHLVAFLSDMPAAFDVIEAR